MSESYTIKPVSRTSDSLTMATIQYDSFNDPSNTTPDEISQLIEAEIATSSPSSPPPTRDERIKKTIERQNEFFDNPEKFHVIGIFYSSSSSPPTSEELVGFAVWLYITPSSPLDSIETDKKEKQDPSLLNRFFAKMNRTREETMKAKSYWYLKLLCISPNHQRKGLGTKLLRWGVDKAEEQGIDAYLESSPMGKRAYLKAGFRVLGMDRVEAKNAKRGYVEWPYMIHQHTSTQQA